MNNNARWECGTCGPMPWDVVRDEFHRRRRERKEAGIVDAIGAEKNFCCPNCGAAVRYGDLCASNAVCEAWGVRGRNPENVRAASKHPYPRESAGSRENGGDAALLGEIMQRAATDRQSLAAGDVDNEEPCASVSRAVDVAFGGV